MKKLKLKNKFNTLNQANRIYNSIIPIIGLTGGIATGKTTIANFLIERKLPLISADSIVKEVYAETESIEFIESHFPEAINQTRNKKNIDFKILRQLFFENSSLKNVLENYLYQKIPKYFQLELKKLDVTNFIIYDVPLLFEKKLSKLFDLTICVYSKEDQQKERLILRDKIDQSLAKKMIESQINIEEKAQLSDYIIDNTQEINSTKVSINYLIDELFY